MPYLEDSKFEQKRLNNAVQNLKIRQIRVTKELIIMQFIEGSELTITHKGGLQIQSVRGSW